MSFIPSPAYLFHEGKVFKSTHTLEDLGSQDHMFKALFANKQILLPPEFRIHGFDPINYQDSFKFYTGYKTISDETTIFHLDQHYKVILAEDSCFIWFALNSLPIKGGVSVPAQARSLFDETSPRYPARQDELVYYTGLQDKLVYYTGLSEHVQAKLVWPAPPNTYLGLRMKNYDNRFSFLDMYIQTIVGETTKRTVSPKLPNLFEDGHFCMGNGIGQIANKSLNDCVRLSLELLFNSPWNHDLIDIAAALKFMRWDENFVYIPPSRPITEWCHEDTGIRESTFLLK